MNILEEIQNCPVEWKELGEVVEVLDSLRRPITKSQRIPGDIPYYGANGIQDYVKDWIFDGTFILMGEDGSVIKNDNSPILHWVIGKIWVNNHAHILGEVPGYALLKYVYYVLSQTDVSDIVRGTPPKLNQKNLKSIKIPIPPLEIQKKIVQILDKFTEYVTELTSELTSRKKQYSFYRDKLLSFEDEVYQVEWKKLNECLKKGKGTKITASQMKLLHKDSAPIRIFAGGKTYADVNYGDIPDKDIHTEEAIVVKSRGIIDFEYCTEPFSFKNEFWSYSSDNENINLRYIYHYLVHNKEHFQNIANNMQMPQISSNDTEKFKIPVPSLEIQSRIVQVLDNFDMVCHDLNIGLPKEIDLRQKQYEYFREKLLTFVAEGEYSESRVEEWDNSAIIKLLQWVFGPIRVELGAVCDFVRGNGLQKKDFTEIGKSVIHYGQIYTKYDFSVSETLSKTSEIVFKKLKKAQPNDLVMATTSENVEDVGKAIVWEGKEEIGISGDSYIIQTTQNSRYLNYWLRSTSFQTQKERKVTGTKVIRINSKDIEKFQIILPSLTEQERIVSILDNFNTLTNSLSEGLPKEIELRQKQYEYWREQLLNFDL
ncbi:type I restriction modification DNA specificity domain protein [Streptococcus oralis SK1074]|uniref:restriction endonuclease subunit S n=2 Tax=Streptococcus oralis TaxID=1303 RepID=UPI00025AA83F|nr:restriction endonuclease subunit S [Streptococcus oralis]EID24941.1 type I restriction modification DNA specificity domain protein [Streptococcus oralis SK1074]